MACHHTNFSVLFESCSVLDITRVDGENAGRLRHMSSCMEKRFPAGSAIRVDVIDGRKALILRSLGIVTGVRTKVHLHKKKSWI